MKIKIFLLIIAVASAFLLFSCSSSLSQLNSKETFELFPIKQNGKWGYINKNGEVIIQPQFDSANFFFEDLALVKLGGKIGYIDKSGNYVINPQFDEANNFSEDLAVVKVGNRIGYIDKTGKFAINPQFDIRGICCAGHSFSEGLAVATLKDKEGYIDKTGKFIINPQFENAYPFHEGLAAAMTGGKYGFIDKTGKFVINPQFNDALPFFHDLALIQQSGRYGYINKEGKIVINPQFDLAFPFSEEGLALVVIENKIGFIDKYGKYVINPQFEGVEMLPVHSLLNSTDYFGYPLDLLSFSEGLGLVRNSVKKKDLGDNSYTYKSDSGYIDATGKYVINPQFTDAQPFYRGLAIVQTDLGMAYIDKEGKYVWRETKETQQTNTNTNTNVNMMNSNMATPMMNDNTMSNSSSTSPSNQKTGRLTTDTNIRSEANKDSASLGIHFKDAKVRILDETSYEVNGIVSTWYKIRITDYGCSKDTSLGCGKNSPNDADEGWVNSKVVLLN